MHRSLFGITEMWNIIVIVVLRNLRVRHELIHLEYIYVMQKRSMKTLTNKFFMSISAGVFLHLVYSPSYVISYDEYKIEIYIF
jgi:hypothetical protein